MDDRSRPELLSAILEIIDPRLRPAFEQACRVDAHAMPAASQASLPIALVGHRAAGKSRLLPWLARWTGLPAVDLDHRIETQTGRAIREWLPLDEPGFRAAERATFAALEGPRVVAVGGGFLSLHGDLLAGHLAVLVPITLPTYRERLLSDVMRPRLRPELSLAAEIDAVFESREALQAQVPTVPLATFLRTTRGPWSA